MRNWDLENFVRTKRKFVQKKIQLWTFKILPKRLELTTNMCGQKFAFLSHGGVTMTIAKSMNIPGKLDFGTTWARSKQKRPGNATFNSTELLLGGLTQSMVQLMRRFLNQIQIHMQGMVMETQRMVINRLNLRRWFLQKKISRNFKTTLETHALISTT